MKTFNIEEREGNDGKVIAGTSLSSNKTFSIEEKGPGGMMGKSMREPPPGAVHLHATCTSRNTELLQISFCLPTTYDLRENMYLYQVFF